jgi:NAD(P)H-dependent FMN reductase
VTVSYTPRILAFAGSLRADSLNKKLARVAAAGAQAAGGEVTYVDLRDFPMPIFDADLEAEGTPETALQFKELLRAHDGLLLAAPEYNTSITAVLKNTLDWASRATPGEPSQDAFDGKIAALFSASPGALGGLRGLVHVRAILGGMGVLVLPGQVAVPRAHEAFTAEGALADARTQTNVDRLAATLVDTVRKLRG